MNYRCEDLAIDPVEVYTDHYLVFIGGDAEFAWAPVAPMQGGEVLIGHYMDLDRIKKFKLENKCLKLFKEAADE